MTEWINNPVVVVAVLSVAGLIFAAGQWVGRVNSHVSGVSALLKEIRFDTKEILGRLPSVAEAGYIAEIATRIYAEKFQEDYEQQYYGYFVVIDVSTHMGYLGEYSDDAFDAAELDNAKGPLFLIRIGHTSAFQMGCLGSQYN